MNPESQDAEIRNQAFLRFFSDRKKFFDADFYQIFEAFKFHVNAGFP